MRMDPSSTFLLLSLYFSGSFFTLGLFFTFGDCSWLVSVEGRKEKKVSLPLGMVHRHFRLFFPFQIEKDPLSFTTFSGCLLDGRRVVE